MRQRQILIVLSLALASAARAQDTTVASAPIEDKRAFGVLPNNRTTEAFLPFVPLSAGHKINIAVKDSFAIPLGLTSGAFAVLYQFEDQNPSFGQGMAGYSRRLATSYGDQVVGNMMTEGVLPALLHEDPRYFRVGYGSKWSRAGRAVAQIFVTRTDSNGRTFNFSEWGGNAVSAAVSNVWYPDSRTASENAEKLLMQCGTDALSNVLKEFWPDVKAHFDRRREARRERKLRAIMPPAGS
jgi:hypothetical protein